MNEYQTCPKCGRVLEVGMFNWRYKLLGIKQRVCRDCQSKYHKNRYNNNREAEIERTTKSKLQRVADAKQFIEAYLGEQYCHDCGEYRPDLLTFDHIRGKKKSDVSTMVYDGYSIDKIMEEIRKCETVCYNCHHLRTVKRKDHKRELPEPRPSEYKQDHWDYPRWYREETRKREEWERKHQKR